MHCLRPARGAVRKFGVSGLREMNRPIIPRNLPSTFPRNENNSDAARFAFSGLPFLGAGESHSETGYQLVDLADGVEHHLLGPVQVEDESRP
jgi:hypothetical protein